MNDYLRETYYSRMGIIGRDIDELNVVACRLMLDIMPGLETSVVFQVTALFIVKRKVLIVGFYFSRTWTGWFTGY